MDGLLWIAAIGAMVGVVLLGRAQAKRDTARGVIATFMDLRLTPTTLLIGRGGASMPVKGLTARVEDAGHGRSVYLSIVGPSATLLREQSLGRRVGLDARRFADLVNRYGR
jgi:hypothetical protein